MPNINFQELFEIADQNIMKKITEKQENTEKVANEVFATLTNVLTHAHTTSGVLEENDLGETFKKYERRSTSWKLDDEKLSVVLDYSYTISDDIMSYCGPRGFEANIDFDYLKEILESNGINFNHKKTNVHKDEPGWFGETKFYDIFTFTVYRSKDKTRKPKK